MKGKTRFNLTYVLLAVVGILVLNNLMTQMWGEKRLSYSEFQKLLSDEKVGDLVVSSDEIHGTLKEEIDGRSRFVTVRVDEDLVRVLTEAGVEFRGEPESRLVPILLTWLLPMAIFLGLWIFLARRMASREGSFMSIGKSKAKVYVESDTKISFDDVAGVDEAKAELQETVAFLKDPGSYGRLGARMPRGILLVGPPGTGKTLLARAVAGEAGVPFLSISGSEFVEMFVGVGAARVRDLFEQARQKAPCIIFVDELDALGRARNAFPGMGGHDEKEQTLNQLLTELDGFDPTTGIVLLAATNRPEILDPALLRAGRFDRQVLIDRPDKIGRAQILEVHMRKIHVAPAADADEIAALTPGFTGADLANLVNEAALVATRRGGDDVTLDDFTAAIERLVAGLERRSRLLRPKEREIVAHHEMGHALVAAAIPGTDAVHKVSIIPRGIGALGYTLQRPTEDRYLMTRSELEAKMAVLLGGRAAEHLIFGHLSTGAADDLAKATDIARSMAARFGMVEGLGHAVYEAPPSDYLGPAAGVRARPEYGDDTAREIDGAVRELVGAAFARAREILELCRPVLEEGARELLAKETLTEAELRPLFRKLAPGEATA